MTSSPPESAPEYRADVDAVSPKPLLLPSPTNIPILEMSMDPEFTAQVPGVGEDMSASGTQLQPSNFAAVEAPPQALDVQVVGQSEGEVIAHQPGLAEAEDHAGNGEADLLTIAGTNANGVTSTEPTNTTENATQSRHTALNAPSEDASEPIPPDFATGTELHSTLQDASNSIAAQAAAPNTIAGVDIQALLDNLTSTTPTLNVETNRAAEQALPSEIPYSSLASPQSAFPGNSSLPPRPPPQEKPPGTAIPPTEDIRNYHKIPSANYRVQTSLPSALPPGITSASNLPPPPGIPIPETPQSATQQSPPNQNYRQRDSLERAHEDEDETPWPREVQDEYDAFLASERVHVDEGKWDQFPAGSRLFIGNLATEKVTKRDIFHIFHKHGKLAQISIKQAYGFVQFLDAASAERAKNAEIDRPLRGKKINIEVSKAQRNSKKNNDRDQGRRRSRSPDYGRGARVDRYTSGQGPLQGRERGRDDYRPARSPSPARNRRGGRARDHDVYDGTRRRSRSPYGRHYHDANPRMERGDYDGLDLPRRLPQDVPEVQFLMLEDLDRNFVGYVTRAFADRGIRYDVLALSSRYPLDAVLNRQAFEGVLAVSMLTRASQIKGRIPLRLFNRSVRGQVTFDDYEDLDPPVCVDLVMRAKGAAHSIQPQAAYGMPQQPQGYGLPQQPPAYGYNPPAPQPAVNANAQAAQLLSALPPHELQSLLAAHGFQQAPAAHAQQQPSAAPVDVNRLLASIQANQGQQPNSTPGGQPNMAEIMANLTAYKR